MSASSATVSVQPMTKSSPRNEQSNFSTAATSTELSNSGSYLGRGEYLVPIDEENAKRYPVPGRESMIPEMDRKFLHELGAFELPSRSVYDSLISHFMDRCHPWMPIVESWELQKIDDRDPSILLLQAVFVAGSRVSTAPQAQSFGRTCYQRAKALFHCGVERDPLTIIRAICLLQWWNPSGPEHVSMEASSFWLHMGVGLAHQVGLHREPNPKQADASLRRRLWWTLFVRICLTHISCRLLSSAFASLFPTALYGAAPSLYVHRSDISGPGLYDFHESRQTTSNERRRRGCPASVVGRLSRTEHGCSALHRICQSLLNTWTVNTICRKRLSEQSSSSGVGDRPRAVDP